MFVSHLYRPLVHHCACLWWCSALRPDEAFVYSGAPEHVRHTPPPPPTHTHRRGSVTWQQPSHPPWECDIAHTRVLHVCSFNPSLGFRPDQTQTDVFTI